MRLLVIATGDFALPAFAAMADAGHEIPALVTQPDRPSGRGRRVSTSRIKQAALERGVAVLQPERIATAEMTACVADLAPDVVVVVAYGQKIPEAICRLPPRGAINVHGSLLPALRGAAPCNWAIINGLSETGVTVQYLAQTMDAGDVLAARAVSIGPRETAPELHDRLAVMGGELLLEVLRQIEAGTARAVPQDESGVTFAPRLKKEDCVIDWRSGAREIDCRVRGLKPWPGACTYLDRGARGRLRLIVDDGGPVHASRVGKDAAPGTVVEVGKTLLVATGQDLFHVVSLKPESGRVMSAEAFCNGHDVKVGDVFEPCEQ